MDMRKLKRWGESPSPAFVEGSEARESGKERDECPYIVITNSEMAEDMQDWHLGWGHMNLYLSCTGEKT